MTDELAIYAYVAVGAAVVFVVGCISWTIAMMHIRNKLLYMLDSFEDGELNFRFDNRVVGSRRINVALNRIRDLFDKWRSSMMEREAYYGQMLDHVKTGIVVMNVSDGGKGKGRLFGRVEYCNSMALSLLGFSTFGHAGQLRIISNDLYNLFVGIEGEKAEKISFYNEKGRQVFAISATETSIKGQSVKVIVFNDVSNESEESEELAWNRLIRVLTHEIMNTVTPIATLSEALSQYGSEDYEYDKVKAGLETIAASSRGLIKFVESYRTLTRVPVPVKKAFMVKDLINSVLDLVSVHLEESGARCIYREKSDDILLYADFGQISQILVNLVKNALQAGASLIEITAEINYAESVVITVGNNGVPVSKESRSQIFVPFFTTKQNGTGIGLSLSRQILRLHNGSIQLTRSDNVKTVFTLVFK